MTLRWLYTLSVASLLLLSSMPLFSGLSSNQYDEHFRNYGTRFMSDYDWRWLKAQGYQESLFNPEATSRAGAQGIMQVMPGTWDEVTRDLGIIASPYNPQINILVGAYYMKRMLNIWKAPRTKEERLLLAQASYNAGAGNVLAAQIKCQNKLSWNDISPCLKNVTGKHSNETLVYVQRIRRWYNELFW